MMQSVDLDSSVPAHHPSSATQSPNEHELPDTQSSENAPGGIKVSAAAAVDHQSKSPDPGPAPAIVPPSYSRDGTTTSHIASPHPTQAEAPADQAILSSPAAVPGPCDSVAAPAPASASAPANPTSPARRPSVPSPKMLFADLYKSTKLPLMRLRQHSHSVPAAPEYDADLVSRDKLKQKDAVKRFLGARIRNDWEFKWPPASEAATVESGGPEAAPSNPESSPITSPSPSSPAVDKSLDDPAIDEDDEEDDAASAYSTISEDPVHYRPRAEWLSDISDGEGPVSPSAYRFDSPEAVGTSVKTAEVSRSAKRRRAVRAEMEWNSGLACFSARRDAWTEAKMARVRPKPTTPAPISPTTRHLSFWRLSSSTTPSSPTESAGATAPLSPSATRTSGDTTVVSSSDTESKEVKGKQDPSAFPVETLLPIAPPLLPPANPMRASITPASYPSIYDKIVVHSMTPSCPVNLGDITRACVSGWKRDGEWPPRSMEPPPVVAVRRKKNDINADKAIAGRRMSFNFLGRRQSNAGDLSGMPRSPTPLERGEDLNGGGKGIKRSLQRVLGFGQERTGSNTSNHGTIA